MVGHSENTLACGRRRIYSLFSLQVTVGQEVLQLLGIRPEKSAFWKVAFADQGCWIGVGNSPYHKESGLRLNHVCESARSTWTYNGLPVEVPCARAGSHWKTFSLAITHGQRPSVDRRVSQVPDRRLGSLSFAVAQPGCLLSHAERAELWATDRIVPLTGARLVSNIGKKRY